MHGITLIQIKVMHPQHTHSYNTLHRIWAIEPGACEICTLVNIKTESDEILLARRRII